MIAISYRSQSTGIPSRESEGLVRNHAAVVTGDLPRVTTQDGILAGGYGFPALTVVGFSGGLLVPATWDGVKPIGVSVISAPIGIAGISVYRTGCFNPDALVWDSSFDTDAKKFAAFDGAPSATQVVLRRPYLVELFELFDLILKDENDKDFVVFVGGDDLETYSIGVRG